MSEETTTEGTGRAARKVREGIVTSDKMDRTAVVTVTERVRHRKYNKTLRQDKKLKVRSKIQLCKRNAWTVPTLIGTTMFVRDRHKIMALDLSEAANKIAAATVSP